MEKSLRAKSLRLLVAISIMASMMLMLTGCPAGSGSSGNYGATDTATVNGFSSDSYSSTESVSNSISLAPTSGKTDDSSTYKEEATQLNVELNTEKLVYTASVELEVQDFDSAINSLKSLITEFNGIIQSENIHDNTPWEYYFDDYSSLTNRVDDDSGYKYGTLVVRIPTKNFNDFLANTGNIGHVTSQYSDVDNITTEYYDTKSYLESYQSQMEALQEMYDRATTIDEMLEIQTRIYDVQAEINRLSTKIQSMDVDVAYSTISIYIDEVESYSKTAKEQNELSFGAIIGETFKESCEDALEFLQGLLLFIVFNFWKILIVLAIAGVMIFFLRKAKKKSDSTYDKIRSAWNRPGEHRGNVPNQPYTHNKPGEYIEADTEIIDDNVEAGIESTDMDEKTGKTEESSIDTDESGPDIKVDDTDKK